MMEKLHCVARKAILRPADKAGINNLDAFKLIIFQESLTRSVVASTF